MNPIQTGIAVALALGVITIFFIFPGLSPFAGSMSSPAAVDTAITIDQTTAATTMPIEDTGELQITDTVVGTGAVAATGDTVTVNYVGALTDGTVFDASANHGSSGFTFPLGAGQVIQGWDQGVPGMREGGKRRLVVPATLGYGAQEYGPIPANSILVFEVELVKVQKR